MRKILRKWNRAAVLGLCAALALSGRSYGDVISEKVPSGALAVVKFNNVAATSGKVAKLAEQLGINMFVPQLNDPLGALKQQFKITGGLKDDGEIAFVIVDSASNDPNQRMFALLPTNDYKGLIANLEGATTEGNVTSFKGEDGQTVYIADWGGYAAVGPAKELVGGAPGTGLKLPARATKETAENDLAVFANIAALRGPLQKQLAENRAKGKDEMLAKLKADNQVPPQYHAAIAAAVDQGMNMVDAFLRDADAATIGITLTDAGIKQNVVAEFKSGSYLGKLADGFKGSEAALLAGLPAGKYLGFGGFTNSPASLTQLIDDVAGPIVAALPKDDEKVAFVPGYIADLKGLIGEIKGQSFGLVTPTAPIGQGAIFQPIGVMQGDATKILASMKAFNEKHGAAMNALMAASQPGMEMKQTYAAGARTVGGVSFDSVATEITGDSPQANQQRQAMQFAYGSPKVEFFLGNADGHVVSFLGAMPDETVQGLIEAAKTNATPLASVEPVKLVADQLPKARFAEAYVGVDEIVGVALRAASQFGFLKANSVQLPPDLPPIGLSLTSENSAIEYRAYVSSDLLQALVSAGMQVAAQMQGGGQGQRGGGGL